jgi:hypothetical protein
MNILARFRTRIATITTAMRARRIESNPMIESSRNSTRAAKPMSAQDLKLIEEQLDLQLPDWYRAALSHYPFAENTRHFFSTAKEIIRANKEKRAAGWFGFQWPACYFDIGETMLGDVFFIHLRKGMEEDIQIYRAELLAEQRKASHWLLRNLCEMRSVSSLGVHVEMVSRNTGVRAAALAAEIRG